MNTVGIDVSKSMVAVIRAFGKIIFKPFEVGHTQRHHGTD